MSADWIQIRGDPSIREFLFQQERKFNEFDNRIDEVLARVALLVIKHGVFHAKVHFSSGQVTLWLINDPLNYRVLVKKEFLCLDALDSYPSVSYAREAVIRPQCVHPILAGFKRLRLNDPQVYLRSGSLNVVNGLVGLNFSCDGSHYINHGDFLLRLDEIASQAP